MNAKRKSYRMQWCCECCRSCRRTHQYPASSIIEPRSGDDDGDDVTSWMSEGCVWARCASWMAFLSPFVAEDHKVCTLTHFLRTNGISSDRTPQHSVPRYTVKAKSRVTVHENVFVFEIKPGFCYKTNFTFWKDKLHYFYCMGCGLWVVAAPSAVFHLHQNVQRHRSLCPACSIAKRTIFSRSHSLAITLALSIFLPHLSSS